jgi:phosphoglycerate dehydrogenase-like enzyme
MMKPKVLLVNTSREGDRWLILFSALKKAAWRRSLDVFASEPISGNHPLAKLENVVLSPHIGSMTQEAGERLSDAVSRQVRDILEGRRPECLIGG